MTQNLDSPPPLPGQRRDDSERRGERISAGDNKKPGLIRRWFWAPIRSGENWAQTVFRVLGNLFRTTLTVIIILIAAGAITAYIVDQQYQHERETAQLAAEAADPRRLVTVEIDQSFLEVEEAAFGEGCSQEFPFPIIVRNDSDLALTETWLEVSLRRRGTQQILKFRGTDLRGNPSDEWRDADDSDYDFIRTIILPKSTHGYCRKFPPEKFFNFDPEAKYVYQVEVNWRMTKTEKPEAWMYEELDRVPPQ